MFDDPSWGLLPDTVLTHLRKKAWDNRKRLKQLLRNDRPFPIEISLKAPNGQQALSNLDHFHHFYKAWESFIDPQLVQWEQKSYRKLSSQRVPVKLVVPSLIKLCELLGTQQELKLWTTKLSNLVQQCFVPEDLKYSLSNCLIEHLEQIEKLNDLQWRQLIQVVEQLKPNMGEGLYLRALPLEVVDTKFLELNITLIEAISSVLHDSEVSASGGLLAWLNCLDSPKGWLTIRPLCTEVQKRIGGLPVLKLSSDVLKNYELPAAYIFVIENIQSGLSFPHFANGIVVCGGGKNITWMEAAWLKKKKVFYWGDLDSEGLNILSMVREKHPAVIPLMMDEATVLHFQERMVDEPDSISDQPNYLTEHEQVLFHALRAGAFNQRRLEQERISVDWILKYIEKL